MRLKVSPKEALITIDVLIYKGYDIYSSLHDRTAAMPMDDVNLSREDRLKVVEWHDKATDKLSDIFTDFTPIYLFVQPLQEQDEDFDSYMRPKKYSTMLKTGLHVLSGYYQQLTEQIYTPLFYIFDKAQICFFASVCPLEPDSNEDAICRFLFKKYNYHEWVEMEDIVVGAFGGNKDEYSTQDKAKVENAYDGVNRKTNEAFGFPLLKKSKTLVALNLPSRFLREERREMA